MDPLVSQLGIAGIVVAILVTGLRWMTKSNETMQTKLDANAAACAEREHALSLRLQALEDDRTNNLTSVIQATLETLRLSASALQNNSGTFQALIETGKQEQALERRTARPKTEH